MDNKQMPRFTGAAAFHLAAPPRKVFPLLCPVLEYDWIPHWECELLYSETGVAEADCVFTTNFPERGKETWTCTRYEPPRAIEYVRFGEAGMITHLSITLVKDLEGGTGVLWNTMWTAVNEAGVEKIATLSPEWYTKEARAIEFMLAHYLKHGTAAAPDTDPLSLHKTRQNSQEQRAWKPSADSPSASA